MHIAIISAFSVAAIIGFVILLKNVELHNVFHTQTHLPDIGGGGGDAEDVNIFIQDFRCCNAAKSAMVSIIGLDSEKVQELCDAANQEVDEADKVQIANYLCIGNYAVSGGLKGIEAVEAKAKSFKARMTEMKESNLHLNYI
ncbi:hypothetical protein ACFE04_012676 [Oxalis oulophora]